jgi:hypothetical protein
MSGVRGITCHYICGKKKSQPAIHMSSVRNITPHDYNIYYIYLKCQILRGFLFF